MLQEVLDRVCDTYGEFSGQEPPFSVHSVGNSGDSPLHVALWQSDTEAVRVLIENGADVNRQGDMGETPLHIAIRDGNLEAVNLLLGAGASTKLVSGFGRTPVDEAAFVLDSYQRILDRVVKHEA